jgi:hypothetical protein
MAKRASEFERIARRYTNFAVDEARGVSESYERLALAVAASSELTAFLAGLPADRRQPNLFFAAVRHVSSFPESAGHLVEIVGRRHRRIREVMLSRTTQTNEPARCCVILPLLARLKGPLALLEIGASAGLCLLPDRYGYDYGAIRIAPQGADTGEAPVFPCAVTGAVPLPASVPRIVWRMGIDLNPIGLHSEDDAAWLETLVWPGQEARARRLRAAITIAKRDPPTVVKGDLLMDLAALIAAAPQDATLVVFHTAVFPYVVPQERRNAFAETVRNSRAVWISNEAPGLFPDLAKAAPPSSHRGRFLLAQDGIPVAWTSPHGQAMEWFGSDPDRLTTAR